MADGDSVELGQNEAVVGIQKASPVTGAGAKAVIQRRDAPPDADAQRLEPLRSTSSGDREPYLGPGERVLSTRSSSGGKTEFTIQREDGSQRVVVK